MPNDIRTSLVSEFAPPMIDGAQYEFPIRTALCHVKGTANHTKLFDNTNIAYTCNHINNLHFHNETENA